MDAGETFHQTATREYFEETLVRCGTLHWIGALEVGLPPWPTYLLGNFWARYDEIQKYECCEGQDLQFIRALKERHPHLPVVFLSLYASQLYSSEDKRLFNDAAFFPKPFENDAVSAAVALLSETRRQEDGRGPSDTYVQRRRVPD